MGQIIGGDTRKVYEKVAVDEWLLGTIDAVQYDPAKLYNHKNKETQEWEKLTAPHVRFKFRFDGYEYPHYSRWMKASTNEKSNLYSKYLKYLCPNHDPMDQAIDVGLLAGVRVKVMWENHEDFQNITSLRGLDPDLSCVVVPDTAPRPVAPDETGAA